MTDDPVSLLVMEGAKEVKKSGIVVHKRFKSDDGKSYVYQLRVKGAPENDLFQGGKKFEQAKLDSEK